MSRVSRDMIMSLRFSTHNRTLKKQVQGYPNVFVSLPLPLLLFPLDGFTTSPSNVI